MRPENIEQVYAMKLDLIFDKKSQNFYVIDLIEGMNDAGHYAELALGHDTPDRYLAALCNKFNQIFIIVANKIDTSFKNWQKTSTMQKQLEKFVIIYDPSATILTITDTIKSKNLNPKQCLVIVFHRIKTNDFVCSSLDIKQMLESVGLSVPVLSSHDLLYNISSKMLMHLIVKNNSEVLSAEILDSESCSTVIENMKEGPFAVKACDTSQGIGLVKINNKKELKALINFLQNNGTDISILNEQRDNVNELSKTVKEKGLFLLLQPWLESVDKTNCPWVASVNVIIYIHADYSRTFEIVECYKQIGEKNSYTSNRKTTLKNLPVEELSGKLLNIIMDNQRNQRRSTSSKEILQVLQQNEEKNATELTAEEQRKISETIEKFLLQLPIKFNFLSWCAQNSEQMNKPYFNQLHLHFPFCGKIRISSLSDISVFVKKKQLHLVILASHIQRSLFFYQATRTASILPLKLIEEMYQIVVSLKVEEQKEFLTNRYFLLTIQAIYSLIQLDGEVAAALTPSGSYQKLQKCFQLFTFDEVSKKDVKVYFESAKQAYIERTKLVEKDDALNKYRKIEICIKNSIIVYYHENSTPLQKFSCLAFLVINYKAVGSFHMVLYYGSKFMKEFTCCPDRLNVSQYNQYKKTVNDAIRFAIGKIFSSIDNCIQLKNDKLFEFLYNFLSTSQLFFSEEQKTNFYLLNKRVDQLKIKALVGATFDAKKNDPLQHEIKSAEASKIPQLSHSQQEE